jgi:hypothetical protein
VAARRTAPAVDYREILPEILAQVAEAAGLEAALRLRRELGGTQVHVARTPKPDTLLVRKGGPEAARALADLVGGETVKIPKGRHTQAALIEHLLSTGTAVQEIARLVGCDAETVRRRKNGRVAATAQGDLFAAD